MLSIITVKLPVSEIEPQLRMVFVTELYLLLKELAASLTVSLAVMFPVKFASHPNESLIINPKSCVSVRSLLDRNGACQVRARDSSSAEETLRVLLRDR